MNVLAEAHQCFVVYPAQPATANGSKCWNWFEAAHQQRGRGEPAIIAGLTRQIIDTYRVDERRIYVAGLSAGGAMAITMAMTYPDLYAAVGIHSGIAHGIARDLPSALSAMHGGSVTSVRGQAAGAHGADGFASSVPAIVFHGDRDTTVHPCNGDQVIAQCAPSPAVQGAAPEGAHAPQASVTRGRAPHGHYYTRTTYHNAGGQPVMEHWLVHGAGHAWAGGSSHGSYTDARGPDASQEMLRFFFDHPQGAIV
jgi:poly(hydroxyalkanoate) depolymerase family esterase